MLRNEHLLLNISYKTGDLFWYTENLRMYSKSLTTMNIKHIYFYQSLLVGCLEDLRRFGDISAISPLESRR